jgi:hypothetical protein
VAWRAPSDASRASSAINRSRSCSWRICTKSSEVFRLGSARFRRDPLLLSDFAVFFGVLALAFCSLPDDLGVLPLTFGPIRGVRHGRDSQPKLVPIGANRDVVCRLLAVFGDRPDVATRQTAQVPNVRLRAGGF